MSSNVYNLSVIREQFHQTPQLQLQFKLKALTILLELLNSLPQ